TRVVAHRDLNHAEPSQGAFEYHLNRPAISRFFQRESAQYIRATGPKRTEITDFQSIQKPDQASGETIPKYLMPWQSSGRTPLMKAGAERNVRTPLSDGRQEIRQFRGPITVIAIKEHNHIRRICRSQARQAGSPIAAAGLLKHAGSHPSGDLGGPVVRIAVHNDDLRCEIGRKIR